MESHDIPTRNDITSTTGSEDNLVVPAAVLRFAVSYGFRLIYKKNPPAPLMRRVHGKPRRPVM